MVPSAEAEKAQKVRIYAAFGAGAFYVVLLNFLHLKKNCEFLLKKVCFGGCACIYSRHIKIFPFVVVVKGEKGSAPRRVVTAWGISF